MPRFRRSTRTAGIGVSVGSEPLGQLMKKGEPAPHRLEERDIRHPLMLARHLRTAAGILEWRQA